MSAVRVVHFADLHLGMENYGRLDPETGLNTRILDFLKCFDTLVDYAISEDAALAVFAGDAYRNKRPSPTLEREFAKRLRTLTQHGVQVFLLVGNHDVPNSEKLAHSLSVFGALEVPGLTIAKVPGVTRIETKQGPVDVAAIPHHPRSWFLRREEHKDKTPDELNLAMAAEIGHIARRLASEVARRGDDAPPAILTAHLSVSDARVGSERTINIGTDPVIDPGSLSLPEFDYVALGHIHGFQRVGSRYPPAVYCGSMDRVDFGEEFEEKGFCVVDVVRGHTSFAPERNFIRTPARSFLTIDVDCRGADPSLEIAREIDRHNLEERIVRLRVRVKPHDRPLINVDEIRGLLAGAHHVAQMSIECEEGPRARNPALDEAKSPLEALKEYIRTRPEWAERSEELLGYAVALINETHELARAGSGEAGAGERAGSGEAGAGAASVAEDTDAGSDDADANMAAGSAESTLEVAPA